MKLYIGDLRDLPHTVLIPSYSSGPDYLHDMVTWLTDYEGLGSWECVIVMREHSAGKGRIRTTSHFQYHFSHEEDMMMFKLRFGDKL